MNWPYILGTLVGAVLGSVLLGALLGWLVHRISGRRVPYRQADAFGLAVLVVFASFTNQPVAGVPAFIVYGLASLGAYFGLRKMRAEAPQPTAQPRDWTIWRRVLGGVLITAFGALGLTLMFSAFRQLAQPSYGGSPEFSFLIGALLLIPCVFIWRGLLR